MIGPGRAFRVFTLWWAIAAVALLVPMSAAARQSAAAVRGTVSGDDGRPVGGARVAVLDQLGSRLALSQTDNGGRFDFADMPPGTYTVYAESDGRSDARVVSVSAALPVDVALTLTTRVSESVVVQGTTDSPVVATRITIAGEALRQVPTRLASRGVQQLLATLPGWTGEDNGLLHVRGVDDGVLYVEDGIPVYDRVDATFGVARDPAGIGSINVITGYIPPEYGLKAGAVVEVQSASPLRSGWFGTADASVGSQELRAARLMGGGPAQGRTSVGFSVAAEQTDRFLDPVHPDNLHNSGGVLSGEAHLSFAWSDTSLFKLNAAGGRSRYDVPHGEAQEGAGQDQRQRLLQDAQSASWQRFWSATTVSHAAFYRRRVATDLRGSPTDTPLFALSDRTHSRLGALGSITHQKGRQTFKTGFEAARLALGEQFSFAVTDPTETDEAEISEAAAQFTRAAPFEFRDNVDRMQWALYVQDSVRATNALTIDLGIRFDRTRLLLPASQWSPRLGLAYAWPSEGTTLRASVNRFFQPPQPEHLLLSSSPQARALSPFADDDSDSEDGGADLEPERQTAWEIGLNRWFSGLLRLDAAYWQRHVRNYADPNVFFGTTIIFPNSVAQGLARGLDIRVELPKYRRWSASVSYTLAKVEQVGPINGGLFLESNITEIGPGMRFTPDHDQRHGAAAALTYHDEGRGLLASAFVRYDSGTPLEVDEDDRDELMERPGASMVNFETGRVRARTLLDLMLSKTMHRGRRTTTSVRLGVFNVTDREYALNFGNPFSGTHFGSRRSMRLDVGVALN